MSELPAPPRVALNQTAIFLDVDGTLIEIAPTPESVVVPPDLVPMLQQLHHALDGALAIVSGRTIAVLDHLLGNTGLPMAGVHGGELRPVAGGAIAELNPHLPASLQEKVWAIINELKQQWPGVRGEDKGPAFSFHFRQAPEAEPALRAAIAKLDLGSEWEILPGHMIYEIRSRGQSKAVAIERLMAMPAFAGREPVFAGDDRTDLDGIRKVAELGGAGIAVAGLKAEQAKWALPDPTAVRGWLKSLLP